MKPTPKIFYGHSISDPEKAPEIGPERGNKISAKNFEEFLSRQRGRIIVTFDDGYADNLTTALSILEKYNVPVLIFVTTGFIARTHAPAERIIMEAINSGESLDDVFCSLGLNTPSALTITQRYRSLKMCLRQLCVSERDNYMAEFRSRCKIDLHHILSDMLSPQQLVNLDNHPLVTIGAHTVSHPNLIYATDAELTNELVLSRQQLSEWLGRNIDIMAYPYGGNNRQVRHQALLSGYVRAYATEKVGRRRLIPTFSKLKIPRKNLNDFV